METIQNGDDFPAILSDTQGLPYRIRTRGSELFYLLTQCAAGLLMGALGTYQLATMPPSWSLVAFPGVLLLWGLGSLYRLWILREPAVIFYPDRIEKRGWRGWRVLLRSGIQGTRGSGAKAGDWLTIVPRTTGVFPVVIQKALTADPIIARWLKGAPDLTADEEAKDKAAILTDNRYGATPAARAKRFDRADAIVWLFKPACFAAAGWIIFTETQYQVHLALIVGALVVGGLLVHLSDGLIVWFPASKARPSVWAAFIPMSVLAYRTSNITLADPALFVICACGGAGLAILFAVRRNVAMWVLAPVIAIFGGLSLYGFENLANVALAPPAGQAFPRRVLALNESGGTKNRSYTLKVAAFAGEPDGEIRVPFNYYLHGHVGDAVCVFRRKGALGVDWYEAADCPAGTKLPPPPQIASTPTSPPPKAAPSYSGPVDYPERAERAGKEGRAVVHCEVVNGGLVDCRVQSENPRGYGFGMAAVGRIMGTDGGSGVVIKPEQLKGRTEIDIPVNFKLAN